MNVLLLSQHFWPESFRVTQVALDLQKQGHHVTVLTGQPNYPEGRVFAGYKATGMAFETHEGLQVCRVPLVPRGEKSAVRLAANYLSFIASASVFGAWMLRGRRFDVVFVYGTSPILQAIAAILLARLKRCAVVTWVQDLWPQSLEVTGYVQNRRALATVERIVRWIYARNDLLLVQSHGFEQPVRALSPPSVDVRFHPNPGDETAQEGGEPAWRMPEGFNIVFAGNLGTVQALDVILDSAALLRQDASDIRIVLVGSGQRDDWLQAQIRDRRLDNVLLAGRFPAVVMPGILAQADGLLVTLQRDSTMELTIPSKVQSYLAAGRPIIASLDGDGARTVADSGAGFVCPAGDPQMLAAAIGRLRATAPDERHRMGEAGRRFFQDHFEPGRLAVALSAHFRAAIAARAKRMGDNRELDQNAS